VDIILHIHLHIHMSHLYIVYAILLLNGFELLFVSIADLEIKYFTKFK